MKMTCLCVVLFLFVAVMTHGLPEPHGHGYQKKYDNYEKKEYGDGYGQTQGYRNGGYGGNGYEQDTGYDKGGYGKSYGKYQGYGKNNDDDQSTGDMPGEPAFLGVQAAKRCQVYTSQYGKVEKIVMHDIQLSEIFTELPDRLALQVSVQGFIMDFDSLPEGPPNAALVAWTERQEAAYAVAVLNVFQYDEQHNTVVYQTSQSDQHQKRNLHLQRHLDRCSLFVDYTFSPVLSGSQSVTVLPQTTNQCSFCACVSGSGNVVVGIRPCPASCC